MTRIADIFAFTPAGNPVGPVAPPTLRVLGGQQATGQQMQYAQQAYYRFQERARLSAVPNPIEAGRLPDGTQYRIVTIAPHTIMEIWPVGSLPASKIRGIGISANYGNAPPAMLVLSYRAGWKVTPVSGFYGGSGLWVSQDGTRYLTDDSLSPETAVTTSISARRFKPGVADTFASWKSTSVLKGLAYDDANLGLGLFSRAGKYVQVSRSYLTVSIAESPVLPESEFSQTPADFAAMPSLASSIQAAEIPQRWLGEPPNSPKGYLRGCRTRSGSAVIFPMIDYESSGTQLGAGWLTNYALTHELVVDMQQGGGYQATIVPHKEPEIVLRQPDLQLQGIYAPWLVTRYERDIRVTAIPSVISASGFISSKNGPVSVSTIIGLEGQNNAATYNTVLERKVTNRNPVFVTRGWQDEKIPIDFLAREEYVLTTDMRGRSIENLSLWSTEYWGQELLPICAHGLLEVLEISPGPPYENGEIDIDYHLRDTVVLGSTPNNQPSGIFASEDIYDSTLRSKNDFDLETPWGVLPLLRRDIVTTTKFTFLRGAWTTNGNDWQTIAKFVSITGTHWERTIKFLDPILGVIGYVEITTGGYTVTDASTQGLVNVKTHNSTAKFVLWHRGETILEFNLDSPDEGERLADGNVLLAGRSVGAGAADGLVFTPAPITTTYNFPALWHSFRENEPVIAATVKCFYNFGQGLYVASNFTRYYADQLTDNAAPKPKAPYGGYPVIVKSALDPNSGGGVVMVRESGILKGAWAIAPDGTRRSLQSVITDKNGAPTQIHDLLVSV